MRFFHDDSGMSLAELLVVSVLIGVIMAAAYFMFVAAQTMNDNAMARVAATDEAQAAIDTMTKELRQAQPDTDSQSTNDGQGVFKLANANDMKFMSDINHDGKPELVRYYVEAGALKRTVAPPTNSQPPFTFGSAGAPKILIDKLGTSTNPVFCFHDRTVNTTVMCGDIKHGFNVVTTSDPYNTKPLISMVGITLDVPGRSGAKTVTVRSRALVRIRTVDNATE